MSDFCRFGGPKCVLWTIRAILGGVLKDGLRDERKPLKQNVCRRILVILLTDPKNVIAITVYSPCVMYGSTVATHTH